MASWLGVRGSGFGCPPGGTSLITNSDPPGTPIRPWVMSYCRVLGGGGEVRLGASGFGFGVWGLEFGVWSLGSGVWGLRFGVWVWGLEFGVWGLVFGVWCLVFGVWCLVFGVWCLGLEFGI